ncbi:MAG: hypothetical protein V1897_09515 [Pseudomonadota bacterium]
MVVAIEITGPYCTPFHNILEGYFQVILVNARRMNFDPTGDSAIIDLFCYARDTMNLNGGTASA